MLLSLHSQHGVCIDARWFDYRCNCVAGWPADAFTRQRNKADGGHALAVSLLSRVTVKI
jgi:hypothetical protein